MGWVDRRHCEYEYLKRRGGVSERKCLIQHFGHIFYERLKNFQIRWRALELNLAELDIQ